MKNKNTYICSNDFLDNQRPKSASLRSSAVRDGKCTVDVFVSCGEPFVPLEGKDGILYIINTYSRCQSVIPIPFLL